MSYPANVATVTVTGTYYQSSGGALATGGVVSFTPNAILYDGGTAQIIEPIPLYAPLVNGHISVVLMATDDPDLAPTGWVYNVVERIDGTTQPNAYSIVLPAASPSVDLSVVSTIATPPAQTAYLVASSRGAANGVASLDNGGQVPLSQLGNAPSGGGSSVDAAAARLGYVAITFAPELATAAGGAGLSAGTFVTDEVYLPAVPISKLACWLVTEGVTPSGSNVMSLYTAAGVLVDSTGDMSAAFATSGADLIIEGTLSHGAFTPSPGARYIVSAVCHFSGSNPKIAATGGLPNTPPENGISPGGYLTGQATPPASFSPSALNQNNGGYWFGVR